MRNAFKGKHGPLLIAEIGGNHEGNLKKAKKMLRLAAEADVDVIKFQIYTGDKLVNKNISPKRNNHFKKFELSINQHIELAKLCKRFKKKYLASVWDNQSLQKLNNYLNFFKVGSGDLTAYPLLKQLSNYNKPIILSTGLSNFREIDHAVKFIRKNPFYKKKNNLALLQCTSDYPTSDNEVNLSAMSKLSKLTKTVGYSNHNIGDLALVTAYCLGAQILEFHFTDDRNNKIFRDHKISLTKTETINLIEKIKRIRKFKKKNFNKPTAGERNSGNIRSFRRAVYLNKDLRKGSIIKFKDLDFLRPNIGLDARNFKKILGKKLKENIKKNQKIRI